jgi:hypothetical protein
MWDPNMMPSRIELGIIFCAGLMFSRLKIFRKVLTAYFSIKYYLVRYCAEGFPISVARRL